MNKNKKIATAVVSTVMAGTMVLSLAACNPTPSGPNTPDYEKPTVSSGITKLVSHLNESGLSLREITNAEAWDTSKTYWDYLSANKSETKDLYGVRDSNGNLKYSVYQDRGNVTLNVAIGHNNVQTSTHFSKSIGTSFKLPDGETYGNGDAKPAWVQMGEDLNITWVDQYTGQQTSKNLSYLTTNNDSVTNKPLYESVDMFTTDLSVATEYAGKGTSILNLADYLDYMPHLKEYLEDNPVVYLSLLQDGMKTTGENAGEGKVLYVAPYFDGNDDIERYCIIRKDWAAKLLNGNTDLSAGAKYSEACAAETSVVSYMGETGNYEIESANSNGTGKITIVKDYDAALEAVKVTTSALGAAYNDIAGAAYTGTSGNIVDIMNAAIAANADVTGEKLVKLYRAYIDVCYKEKGQSGSYYTAETRANLFNGYDAAWDVDDLVAILRCVKTNGAALVVSGNTVQGIVPRTGQNDRTPDMVRLAAQLYGVRGADSRYEYTYIDSKGDLKDSRSDPEFYVALENFHKLKEEGLVVNYPASDALSYNGGSMSVKTDKGEAFMMYDYSQTQTKNGYYAKEGVSSSVTFSPDFNFAPVVTPVSRWDVDGDGVYTDIMRFTESWRSTKTGGLALNGALAATGNENKLKAALQFVDYLFSEDGQIVSTYGPMASNANGQGGFWYNTEATAAQVSAGQYFTYKGTKYAGTEYKGRYTPTVTSALYDSFLGKTVNGFAITTVDDIKGGQCSFTDYARRIIGSTLPVGIKDQSFENQLTSQNGKSGADIVGKGLALGTIKGMTLKIDANNWWYTCVPSGMPVSSMDSSTVLNAAAQDHLKYLTGTQKDNKNFFSIFNYIIINGTTGTYNWQDETFAF